MNISSINDTLKSICADGMRIISADDIESKETGTSPKRHCNRGTTIGVVTCHAVLHSLLSKSVSESELMELLQTILVMIINNNCFITVNMCIQYMSLELISCVGVACYGTLSTP